MCGHCEHHGGGGCGCGGHSQQRGGRAWKEVGDHEHEYEAGGRRCGGYGPHGAQRGHCCHEDRPWGFRRRFTSRAERIQELEAYLSELRAEIAAVEEYLAGLKAAA